MPRWERTLTLRPERVMALGGLDLPARESARILAALGFGVDEAGGKLVAHVPSWRADVEGEADLVEEVEHAVGRLGLDGVLLPVRLGVELRVVALDAQRDVHRHLSRSVPSARTS